MKLSNSMMLGWLSVMSAGAAWADNPAHRERTTSTLDDGDVQTLAELHKSNLAETGHGKLARKSGATPGIRAYGKTLQIDHDAADKSLMALIAKRHVDKSDLDSRVNALISKGKEVQGVAKIHAAAGAEFDRAFASHMAEEHGRSLDKVNAAIERTRDPDVKQLLERVKPVLERHQAMARNLMGNSGTGGNPETGIGPGNIHTNGAGHGAKGAGSPQSGAAKTGLNGGGGPGPDHQRGTDHGTKEVARPESGVAKTGLNGGGGTGSDQRGTGAGTKEASSPESGVAKTGLNGGTGSRGGTGGGTGGTGSGGRANNPQRP